MTTTRNIHMYDEMPTVSTNTDSRLRQLVSMLCWLACGREQRLDEELSNIIHLMSGSATVAELDVARNRLALAIGAQPSPTTVEATASSGSTLNEPLLRLLDGLAAIPQLNERLSTIRQRACSGSGLVDAADQAATLVYQHCSDLEAERTALINLLDQMANGLGELSGHLSSDAKFHREMRDQSSEMNLHILGEVTNLGANVRQASDLSALQNDVRRGLDRINAGLQESRAREEARMRELEQRSEKMKARIDHLEVETQQLRESVAHERETACTDRLTALPNRFAYDLRIKQEQQHSRQSSEPLIIVVWDIDHFKRVNDTFGHHAGDKALQAVSQRLAQQLRADDFMARYGGEEFVMTLRNLQIELAFAATERLRQSVEEIGFHFDKQPVTLTVSCGLTRVRDDDTPESAFERADAALYKAKNAGRNCCVIG